MSCSNYKSSTQPGLTVVELVVAIVIASSIALGLIATLSHIFVTKSSDIDAVALAKKAQEAVDILAEDIGYTTRFLEESGSLHDDTDTLRMQNLRGLGANQRQLFLEQIATTKARLDPNTEPVFLQNAGHCGALGIPMTNRVVYYIKENDDLLYTLYRRTLQQTHLASGTELTPDDLCQTSTGQPATVFQKTTCSENSIHATCVGKNHDIVVAENVSRFSIDYYLSPSDPSPYNNIYIDTYQLRNISTIRIHLDLEGGYPDAPSIKKSILLTKGVSRG